MPHRLKTYLASTELRQLSSKAEQLTALQRHFDHIVPPSLKNSSHVLQLNRRAVTIAATNGAVAAKLRQMTTELISLFQARGCEITGIRIKVQVTIPQITNPDRPRKLGKAAREALIKMDENLAESPLKTALQRLAKRAR